MGYGPGKVIGWDGKQLLVKYGEAVIKAHTFRLQNSQEAVVPETSEMLKEQSSTGNCNETAIEENNDELLRPPTVETVGQRRTLGVAGVGSCPPLAVPDCLMPTPGFSILMYKIGEN